MDDEVRLLGESAEQERRKVRSKIEEARIESIYFRRRFFQPRHCQFSWERLQSIDPRDDMLWRNFSLSMPLAQLSEFGLGYAVYFDHLSCLAVLSGVLTLASAWNYGRAKRDNDDSNGWLLYCARVEAVCLDINCHTYALRNLCPLTHGQSFWDSVSCIVFLVFLVAYRVHRHRLVRRLLLSGSSSSPPGGGGSGTEDARIDGGTAEYTVLVTNPPPDAVDCDEWKAFFEVRSRYRTGPCR
jgi:hypothetical protein